MTSDIRQMQGGWHYSVHDECGRLRASGIARSEASARWRVSKWLKRPHLHVMEGGASGDV